MKKQKNNKLKIEKKMCDHIKRIWCLNCADWAKETPSILSSCCPLGHQRVIKCIKCGEYFDYEKNT